MRKEFLLSVLFFLFIGRIISKEFFVSVGGSEDGEGTKDDPWDFHTAVRTKASQVQGGDTIWIRGGTYQGRFVSKLTGEANNPIIIRNYNNERVIIDGILKEPYDYYTLYINRRYTWYWGLEMTFSWDNSMSRYGVSDRSCIYDEPANDPIGGIKIINCVLHDSLGCGIMSFYSAIGSEIYGNLIYYNGADADDRGHGHAIYSNSVSNSVNNEIKLIEDNILFKQFRQGLSVYSEDSHNDKAYTDNIHAIGNIAFDNSLVSQHHGAYNLLMGSNQYPSMGNKLNNNYAYYKSDYSHECVCIGYKETMIDMEVKNNYIVGDTVVRGDLTNEDISGNTFIGDFYGTNSEQSRTPQDYPNNNFYDRTNPPTVNQIFVRKNKYEEGRANIAVFNWERKDIVHTDVSTVLNYGDCYHVYDVEDLFGEKKAGSGRYNGHKVNISMTISTVTPIRGTILESKGATNQHTDMEFGAFLLLKINCSDPNTPFDPIVDPNSEKVSFNSSIWITILVSISVVTFSLVLVGIIVFIIIFTVSPKIQSEVGKTKRRKKKGKKKKNRK